MDRIELLNRLRENHDLFKKTHEGYAPLPPEYIECDYYYSSVLDSNLSMEEIRLCLYAIRSLYTIRYEYLDEPIYTYGSDLLENLSNMKEEMEYLRHQIILFHSISMIQSGNDMKGFLEEVRDRISNPEKKITCAEMVYESEEEKVLKAIEIFENLVGHQKEFEVINDFLKMKEKYGLEWNLW